MVTLKSKDAYKFFFFLFLPLWKDFFLYNDFGCLVNVLAGDGRGGVGGCRDLSICQSPLHQQELPNCLAVNSCMLFHPSSDDSGSKVAKFKLENKFARPPRPLSRTGSRATSVKGEPACSPMDSNASASGKDKSIFNQKLENGNINKRNIPKVIS